MSTNPEARAWVRVDAGALVRNYRRVAEAAGSRIGVLPMVKADGYGLGMSAVVARLEPLEPWGYGVAAVREGIALREAGVTRPIVVCSPVPVGETDAAVAADLQLSISSLTALSRAEDAARKAGTPVAVHVDVDTGMGRSGFDWRRADSWLPSVSKRSEHLRWVGLYTHLHSADENEASVVEQEGRFAGVLARLDGAGGPTFTHHLNSAGVFRRAGGPAHPGNALVRPGIFLYGGTIGVGQPRPEPVASVHARVVHAREAPRGTTLGYGSTYVAEADERWATLAIGYGDGLPRALGNRGSALVRGVRAPIIGRISMDVTVVDISGVSGVEEGDVATLVGAEGEEAITVDEVARLAGTISYEILTGLTPRLPRVWSDA